ncbi:unnamed protein product [Rotaria socialis]|uniref:Uncharacterized protein n=1 Tax=Rotaria socialis TaxID=392032 RepID=A0A820LZ27_9BILA|nr:unnamed protein product [Rotaria socialis]CAF3465606.1 unnamed protein product [Rotaria socialis]CAF3524492.1 unnamed protein product [Rotaria socialis]CAF3591029.1 unnamed protein product [Rotaria socialis]CAF3755639.1 unnamed protein product [Rotaria socialis]
MNKDTDGYFIQRFSSSPYHRQYYSSIMNDIQPRRNSYQIAINTSKHDHIHMNNRIQMISSSSSGSSINGHVHTTRSLYAAHGTYANCKNDHLQRSISQPAVRSPDSDCLLENATFLLGSPVHALRPAHSKSRTTLPSTNPVSTRSSIAEPESVDDSNDCSNTSSMSKISIYRMVIIRSFASLFALASLFPTEVLQTSIHSNELSFQSLLTFHLCALVGAFVLAAHASRIHLVRYRWTISNVLAYDRFSQILIVIATIFTGAWVVMQYFQSYYRLLLLSAGISGISYSCMIIKSFDHILQLSTSLPIQSIKNLTMRLNIFAFIYNSLCHLALTIGGIFLFAIILVQQYRREYILIGSQPCLVIPCLQFNDSQDENDQILRLPPPPTIVSLTLHLNEKKQEWQNEPSRYIFFVSLLILTIISLLPQAGAEWTTSILSMSRRMSILYYSNESAQMNITTSSKRLVRYRHYLFALFIGFQEGYLFGNITKFDVTCLFGLRHTVEMMIIYGLGGTISSTILAFVTKHISIMSSVSFTTLLHFLTMGFLYYTRTSSLHGISTLNMKHMSFFFFGIVLGLWTTIAIHCLCNATKFSSSSKFAQSLAMRSVGRIIAYACTLLLCQLSFFIINLICLLLVVIFILICYCCCHEKE